MTKNSMFNSTNFLFAVWCCHMHVAWSDSAYSLHIARASISAVLQVIFNQYTSV